jgi:uncharacterized sulfatase
MNHTHTLLASLLLMAPVVASVAEPDRSIRPNFLIIMADDISWTSFGCANPGAFTKTPNIDKLAREGLRFSNFYTSSAVCIPTRHELYTSLLPPSSGMYENGSKPTGPFLNVNDYLGELGYVTGRAGKSHFKSKHNFKTIPGFTANCNADKTEWNMDGVKQFISDAMSERKNFCAFICSVEGHHPWTMGNTNHFPVASVTVPPHMVDTPKTREALSRHAAEVEVFDEQVGASVRLLKEMNLEENTVVIVLSEQGMALPLGKFSAYNFGTRALCVMRWPSQIAAGTTTPAVSMYCDIVPTLVAMAGARPPEGIDGRSLRQVLMGKTTEHRKYAFLVDGHYQRAIASDCYKLVWTPSGEDYSGPTTSTKNASKFFSQAWAEWLEAAINDPDAKRKLDHVLKHPLYELYDIQKDPYELVNLADDPKHTEILKKMTADLKLEITSLKDSMKMRGGNEGDGDE